MSIKIEKLTEVELKNNNDNKIPEIVIPKGYDVNEYLDIDDGDFGEEPIFTEEVKIRFE